MPNEITYLQILTGPPPATLDEYHSGMVLVTLRVPSARLYADDNGLRIGLEYFVPVRVQNSGRAGHFSLVTSEGQPVLYGPVGEKGEVDDDKSIVLPDTNLVAGKLFSITQFAMLTPGIKQ